MDDLARFCCQNSECTLHGRRNAGNLSVCARYGKQDHIRLLYCKMCKYRFSERKGTVLVQQTSPRGGPSPCSCGIRSTGRLVGVDPNTVGRLARIVGQHSHDAHDELVALIPPTRPMITKGGWWEHVAFDAEHRNPSPERRTIAAPCRSVSGLAFGRISDTGALAWPGMLRPLPGQNPLTRYPCEPSQ